MKRFYTLILLLTISISGFALNPIEGPVSCCLGSGVTLTEAANPGGVWTSSDPHVATIGSSSGVVKGLAGGTAEITYTLGKDHVTLHFTVYTWPNAGMITGHDNLTIGHSITLTNHQSSPGTHYWTSCSPEIASVNYATGVVKGISAGATTITYSIIGCGGMAYTTIPIYVTPVDCISGHVSFPGGYNGTVKVSLVHFSAAAHGLVALDSAIYTCTDSSIFYHFSPVPTDSFRVKATVGDTITHRYGFMTTYHSRNYLWYNGNIIYHYAGATDADKDISMIYGRFEH